MDSGAFAACTSPRSYSALADGAHTFAVRAADAEGTTDPTPAERSFTVGTVVDGKASAKKTQKQKGSRIKVKVKAGEDLTAKGSAKVKVKVNGKSRSYRLAPKSKDVAADKKKTLTLRPKRSKDRKKIVKALKQGTKAKAKLKVKLTDGLGNKKTKKLSVKLKG